jgi:hypothetical protein
VIEPFAGLDRRESWAWLFTGTNLSHWDGFLLAKDNGRWLRWGSELFTGMSVWVQFLLLHCFLLAEGSGFLLAQGSDLGFLLAQVSRCGFYCCAAFYWQTLWLK